MFEFFAGVTMTLGFVVMVGLVAVAFGYRGHFRERGTLIYHFSLGIILITGANAARLAYWDLFFTFFELLDPEGWARWAMISGGTNVNSLFLLVMLAGVYHSLKALVFLVPEPDRPRWRWWSVCLYPIQFAIRRE